LKYKPSWKLPLLSALPLTFNSDVFTKEADNKNITEGDTVVAFDVYGTLDMNEKLATLDMEDKIPSFKSEANSLWVYVYKIVSTPVLKRKPSTRQLVKTIHPDGLPEETWGATRDHVMVFWKTFDFSSVLNNPLLVIDYLSPMLKQDFVVPTETV
jgi:hypothetical protein